MAARPRRGEAVLTRGWKIVVGVVAAVVAFDLALSALQSATGGSPGGPRSSSYSTGADGAGAYADLLARAGHAVRRERVPPHATPSPIEPSATLVVLDPPFVVRRDVDVLRAFVRRGGRLLASDDGSGWIARLVPHGPHGDAAGVARARRLRAAPEVRHVAAVATAGDHAWRRGGTATPIVGGAGKTVVAVARIGNGRALLVADSSFLQNRFLAHADDAQLALALAGPPRRPVVFFEGYHGYGRGSGLGAIPTRWKALLALAAFATLVFMLARARRLGPPEDEERPLDPPRREYVEALAATLARTRDRTAALDPVRRELRRRVAVRTGLPNDAPDAELVAAARRLGLADDEAEAAVRAPRTEADVIAAGRALARLADRRNAWRS